MNRRGGVLGGSTSLDDEHGSVAITVSLALTLFLSMLAAVIDLGQIYTARVLLASGTDAATLTATEILATGGCGAFDIAKKTATDRLADSSSTATLSSFEVTYGAVVVDEAADCALVLTDDKVGRVDVATRDTRDLAFAGFFTDDEGVTTSSSAGQWGYVEAMTGGLSPMSLCSQHPAYLAYEQFRDERDKHEADPLVNPPPDPTLLDPFDLEIDGFDGSACEYGEPSAEFGDFVLVDWFGDSDTATRPELIDWVEHGIDAPVLLDDPATPLTDEAECPGEDNDVLGACEGVTQGQSLDQVGHFRTVLGDILTVMVHDVPVCDDGKAPPDFGHCNGGARGHRSYRVDGFVRMRLLCMRISAADPSTSTVFQAPDVAPGACNDLTTVAPDGNPGDDVFIRAQFVLDEAIRAARLTDDPAFDHGFVGYNLCMVDGDDKCELVVPVPTPSPTVTIVPLPGPTLVAP